MKQTDKQRHERTPSLRNQLRSNYWIVWRLFHRIGKNEEND